MADEKKPAPKAKKTFKPFKQGMMCQKCGARMAEHKDRHTCGKCGYTVFSKQEKKVA